MLVTCRARGWRRVGHWSGSSLADFCQRINDSDVIATGFIPLSQLTIFGTVVI